MNISGMIDAIVREADNNIPQNEGDYIEDGLLHCGKCHTKKQTRVNIGGEIITPKCLCKCESERFERERAEQKKKQLMEERDRMRSTGFPDSEMRNWIFERDDGANPDASSVCKKYVEHFDEMRKRGKGIIFYGPVGTGKTFLASCIANALIDRNIPCLVTNFSRMTNTLFGLRDGRQDYIDDLNKFQLLVIDDLASERDTEFMGEIIFNIIDSRYRSGLPLIVTTNLTADELKHPAEIRKQRIFSRLFEMCFAVEVKGRDRRKQKMIADYNELEGLLGL